MVKKDVQPLPSGFMDAFNKDLKRNFGVDMPEVAEPDAPPVAANPVDVVDTVESSCGSVQASYDKKKVKEDKIDPVNPKAVKKDFDDRKDKDIDNDGDTDSSDEYLHKRRKAISKALAKEEVVSEEDDEDECEKCECQPCECDDDDDDDDDMEEGVSSAIKTADEAFENFLNRGES
jgi:hypothetical protein